MTSDALFSQAMHKSDLRLFSNCISLGRRTCTLSCWNASRAAKQMRMLLEGEKSLTCNTRTSWETPKINQNQWCLPPNHQTSWIFGFFMGSSCLFCCFVLQPTSHQMQPTSSASRGTLACAASLATTTSQLASAARSTDMAVIPALPGPRVLYGPWGWIN